jgi:hypothetical protein
MRKGFRCFPPQRLEAIARASSVSKVQPFHQVNKRSRKFIACVMGTLQKQSPGYGRRFEFPALPAAANQFCDHQYRDAYHGLNSSGRAKTTLAFDQVDV